MQGHNGRVKWLASGFAVAVFALHASLVGAQDKQGVCVGQSWNPGPISAAWGTDCTGSSGTNAIVSVTTDQSDGTSEIGFFVMSHGECTDGTELTCSFSTTGYDDNRAGEGNWEYDWEPYIPQITIVCWCE